MALNKTSKWCRHRRLWTAAISGWGIRWGSLARTPAFMAESRSKAATSGGDRSRLGQDAPVASPWLPHSTNSNNVWQGCRVSWGRELGTLSLTGRTQSRLSRWCQAGTLCTKCVVNLVNSQCRTLQGSHLYRWPTVQIQASRICNFIFQVLCRHWSWHINGSSGSLELQKGLDQESHFDLAGNVKNKKKPKTPAHLHLAWIRQQSCEKHPNCQDASQRK